MAAQLAVVVYGNGELYRELFNAIATAFSDSSYQTITHLSVMLAGAWAALRYSMERNLMVLVRWLGLYYFAFYIVFMPKAIIEVLDRTGPGHSYVVANVPLGLAAAAHLSSAVGDHLTQLMEKNFSLPDDLRYGQTGLVMASRLAASSAQFEIADPNFNQGLQSFVKQCVFYDLLLNKYTWQSLLNATNIWQFVSQRASPARTFVHYQAGAGEAITCQTGAARLGQEWAAAIQGAAARYGTHWFPGANDPKAKLLAYLGDSYQFLAGLSTNAANIMQQNLMANALQNGIVHLGAATASPAALQIYAFAKAQQQKRLTNVTVGDMAAYWLPIMKNVLEAVLYGSFVFVFLLLLFPFGPSVLRNYVASLLWLQLWAPMYAVLNLFMNFYGRAHSLGALHLNEGQVGLALSTQAAFAQVNADVASLAGYLSLSVPLLAAGAMKGMMAVFTQAAQYIAGVTQSSATGSAAEAAAGNISLGNTQFSNHSSFNTAANHFDTNAKVFGGAYTYQMEGGSTLTVAPSGATVMSNQGAISQLGTSINLAHAIRQVAGQQAETAYSAALSSVQAYSSSVAAGLRGLYELGGHVGATESSGTGSTVSTSGGVSSALGNLHQLTERFAQDHHVSSAEATRYLGAAYVSGRAGVGASVATETFLKDVPLPVKLGASAGLELGAKGEIDKSRSSEERRLYSEAEDFMRNTNFSHSVDLATRGLQEHSYRTHSEEGQRLANSIGSAFDRAEQARQDMAANLQQAQSYRATASVAEENAAAINSNASQAFMALLAKGSQLSMREIEDMMINRPEEAQALANRFVQAQAQQYLKNFQRTAGASPAQVKQAFKDYARQAPGEGAIAQRDGSNQAEIAAAAHASGLSPGRAVDRRAEEAAGGLIAGSQIGLVAGGLSATHHAELRADKIKGKLKGKGD